MHVKAALDVFGVPKTRIPDQAKGKMNSVTGFCEPSNNVCKYVVQSCVAGSLTMSPRTVGCCVVPFAVNPDLNNQWPSPLQSLRTHIYKVALHRERVAGFSECFGGCSS